MFLKNAWYVACTPDEIDVKPLGRQICGEKIAFYRGAEDKVAAVEDFCPHRGAQLSLGQVCEGKLVCGYHGLVMGCDGKTVSMPGQRVQGFPRIRSAGGLYHIQCDYRLMIDNLMDLTHETYVHTTSIGQKEIDETPVSTKAEGNAAVTSRFMENVLAPPFWRANLRGNNLADDVPVDRWQVCRFTPPSHVMIEVGVAHAGKGGYQADAKDKVHSIVVDFLTPETETSMWYFWGMARNFNPKDKALTAQIQGGQAKVFAEDKQVLEAQQRNLLQYPQRKLLMLNIDAGGVQSRRILDRLIALERPTLQAA